MVKKKSTPILIFFKLNIDKPMILNYNKSVNMLECSSAGSPRYSETHPTKNLINKLLSVPLYGGVAQLGERLNGIQEVKSSILSVSTTAH